jgi:hypothetical protein
VLRQHARVSRTLRDDLGDVHAVGPALAEEERSHGDNASVRGEEKANLRSRPVSEQELGNDRGDGVLVAALTQGT